MKTLTRHRQNRSQAMGGLAFLDIMACGLGAMLLVLILATPKTFAPSPAAATPTATSEETQQFEALKAQATTLANRRQTLEKAYANQQSSLEKLAKQQAQILDEKSQAEADLKKATQNLNQLKDSIKKAPPLEKNDPIENLQGGEEDYLIGLKLEGKRLVFLLDSSASMTDYRIIDILKRKSSAGHIRKNGPKWQRALRILDWLMVRVPKGSAFKLIHYNQNATLLSDQGWIAGGDGPKISQMRDKLRQIPPQGGTNFQAGLDLFGKLNATNLYVITDGLPTQGNGRYNLLSPFAKCPSLRGNAAVISNQCRLKLFRHGLKESRPDKRIVTSVILLPLEGDHFATLEYWSLSAGSGGTLLAPAENWP